MTDLELLLRSLASLMGWAQINEVSGVLIWRTPDRRLVSSEEWRPLHDMNDAMQVVDYLIEKYDCAFILDYDYTRSGKWHAGFGIASDEFPDAVADTRQHAICLAALETGR